MVAKNLVRMPTLWCFVIVIGTFDLQASAGEAQVPIKGESAPEIVKDASNNADSQKAAE